MRAKFEQYEAEQGKEKTNNLSIEEAFEYRNEYILEAGKQLQEKKEVEVQIGGEALKVDYRVISISETLDKKSDPIVLVCGYLSGWEGIAELGFSLAAEGRKVILVSLPGYGNSSNPSKEYYEAEGFHNEAQVVGDVIRQLKESGEIDKEKPSHLVGHSVGAVVLSEYAAQHPEEAASLTLLNPAGLTEPEHPTAIGARFVAHGMHTTAEFQWRLFRSGERDYERELYAYIPEFESSSSMKRLPQRAAEMQKVARADITKSLERSACPLVFISSGLDTVYPPDEQIRKLAEMIDDEVFAGMSVIAGARHNTTLGPDEITAANISHYLDEVEKSREASA